MTAEIAILNRQAVALAADSAMTIGRKRVWKTGNKLFSLSPTNDIGIMIYGSGDFIGYSWEVIAKTFREYIGDKSFESVSHCGDAFLDYLRSDKFKNSDLEGLSILTLFVDVLESVKEEAGHAKSRLENRKKLADAIKKHIKLLEDEFEKLPDHLTKKEFLKAYSKQTKEFAKETFECTITGELHNHVNDLLFLAFHSAVESSFSTGVVVAGYGSEQFFPELIDYKVDGKHGDFVRVWKAGHRNLNDKDAPSAVVVPFAQSDMFQLFMEGITNNHLAFVQNTLIRVLNDKSKKLVDAFVNDADARRVENASQKKDNSEIMRAFFKEFGQYVQKEMVKPVVRVISTLPKEEMAAMAEALVEITTLRRKVDSTIETVGGPTDVAVISKGDGLVWVKRKHYFNIELNRDFIQRKRIRHGGKDEF